MLTVLQAIRPATALFLKLWWTPRHQTTITCKEAQSTRRQLVPTTASNRRPTMQLLITIITKTRQSTTTTRQATTMSKIWVTTIIVRQWTQKIVCWVVVRAKRTLANIRPMSFSLQQHNKITIRPIHQLLRTFRLIWSLMQISSLMRYRWVEDFLNAIWFWFLNNDVVDNIEKVMCQVKWKMISTEKSVWIEFLPKIKLTQQRHMEEALRVLRPSVDWSYLFLTIVFSLLFLIFFPLVHRRWKREFSALALKRQLKSRSFLMLYVFLYEVSKKLSLTFLHRQLLSVLDNIKNLRAKL